MSRPTRLRRPPAKYIKDDNPSEINGKSQKDAKKVKNNPLNALRSPILRDRTNLTIELVKVDNSVKNNDKEQLKMTKEVKEKRGMRTRAQEIKKPVNSQEKIIKKSVNSQEKIVQKLEDKKIVEKMKRQVSLRSRKNSEVQVTEEEPKKTPEVPKITRSSKIPKKIVKNPSKSEPPPEKRNSRSKTHKIASKKQKLMTPSVVINKPPLKSSKNVKTSPRPQIRASRRLTTKPVDKSPKKSEKKFFKSRKNVTLTHSKVSPMKRGLRNPKRPLKLKKSPKSYQPTLKESFARAKKSLRPRKIDNYNEDTKVASKTPEKAKGPVYKNLKKSEDSPKDKNKVYEFSFDINDSNERFQKKRKKRTVRKAPAKRAKIVKDSIPEPLKPKNGDSAKVHQLPKPLPPKLPEKSQTIERPTRITIDRIDQVDENFNDNSEIPDKFGKKDEAESQDEVQETIEVVVDVHEPPVPESLVLDVPEVEKSAIPKITSNTTLEGSKRISLTSTPLNSEIKGRVPSNPFSNRPSSQYRTMMNHSLIRRSFSPIVKEHEKFDVSSPWRPVVVTGFSRVKNIFQSTPQGRKFLTPHGINSLTTENKGATIKINKIEEKNESSVVETTSPKKSPRKFGTVLSNVSSSPSKSPEFRGFDNSPRKMSVGKENEKSPVKSPVKKIKEVFEPKPGPSGLQKDGKILRQSNLNNFLNIPRMPESTSIITAHGIFDENHSTPITGKLKRNLGDFGVGNAFGFDEESTLEVSPVQGVEKLKVVAQRKVEPSRLPMRPVIVEKHKNEEEKIETVAKVKKQAEATKSDVVEAVHFHDTFDAEERETSPLEVPLFVDPEPIHFVEPPRYSYSKRKRAVKFNTSDETENSEAFNSDDDDDDGNHVKHKNKKRKMTKAQKEQQKKLEDWAKNVNQTFDEIEHFDLLVE